MRIKKQIKKYTLLALVVVSAFTFTSFSVSAGPKTLTKYSASGSVMCGESNNLSARWNKVWTISGDAMAASLVGYGNQKRVTAKVGSEGTVSSWAGSKTLSVSVSDVGPWGGSYYTKFEWK